MAAGWSSVGAGTAAHTTALRSLVGQYHSRNLDRDGHVYAAVHTVQFTINAKVAPT